MGGIGGIKDMLGSLSSSMSTNDPMKFNLFGRKPKCVKCGQKFKNETELADHSRTAHSAQT
jgi:hypothetical protein